MNNHLVRKELLIEALATKRTIFGLLGFDMTCIHITEITLKNIPIPAKIKQFIHIPSGLRG
jgi:hypothetical protein